MLTPNLEALEPQKLFQFSARNFVESIRSFVGALNYGSPRDISLKSFRAGKATQLASDGHSLGKILQSGEWRSGAFLRYVDTEAVEISKAFKEVYQSDSEGAEDDN